MGKATQDLRHEHDAILHVLSILDSMLASATTDSSSLLQHYTELVHFLKIFVDKCHHGKEEGFLFKALVENGIPNENGPIGVMLQEHNQGRQYISLMSNALELHNTADFAAAAIPYRDLLRSHIAKENDVLFVMADRVLDENKQDALFEQFEHHEENVIGHGVHEELHAMIDRWATIFKVS
jgi:hemerythrin-like domain-containing protein